jgi:hypothetical protein
LCNVIGQEGTAAGTVVGRQGCHGGVSGGCTKSGGGLQKFHGFCTTQWVNVMPLLHSHNWFSCLSVEEIDESSTDESDCEKDVQKIEQPKIEIIHWMCWE